MKTDSATETIAHITRVQQLLADVQGRLLDRALRHDKSKLESPEKEGFDEVTGALHGLTYGSDEYKGQLEKLKPILAHHYAHNSHHPEHYGYLECNGCFTRYPTTHADNCKRCGYGQFQLRPDVSGMTLLDLVEMFCDWKAATERHADGSIARSIEINTKRFELSPQLVSILENTRKEMGW